MIPIPELNLYLHPQHAERYYRDERYRERWQTNPPYRMPIEPSKPMPSQPDPAVDAVKPVTALQQTDCRSCPHFNREPMPSHRVAKLNLSTVRNWHECQVGLGPICACDTIRSCELHPQHQAN